ncbi:MAG: hypothetical protein E2O68_05950 [Deltaproteobacteria bacterium]|nr:MAG: hypothetical protein E2O68_05950 [Deltaproteobacteria bacterium]
MEEKEIRFLDQDIREYRKWLKLNIYSVTWKGKYTKEFEEFWTLFFGQDQNLAQIIQRFEFAKSIVKVGPLISWLNFLMERLLAYTFIYKKTSLLELSRETGIPVPRMATILRNFFLEAFPYFDEYFNNIFHVGNLATHNLHLTFDKVAIEKKLSKDFYGPADDDILSSLEVTLFDEWPIFIKKLKKHLHIPVKQYKKINAKQLIKDNIGPFLEVMALLLLGYALIIGIKHFNKWYEKILIGKIEIFEPQKKGEGNKIFFKKVNPKELAALKAPAKNLEEITNLETKETIDAEFETESEVILTSWKALPKDFNITDLEHSEYEEFKKRAIRDNRYGNRKIYRIMMESVHPGAIKKKLDTLLTKYQVTQVDNVKPGTYVPGGLYYNIFVPKKFLKEFLAQVMETEEATLYETRTKIKNPLGKGRVFIWIKGL